MKKIILIMLVIFMAGCSNKYEFTKCKGKNQCTTVKIKSRTNYPEGYKARFNAKTNEFTMETGQAIKQENPLEQIGADVVNQLFNELLLRKKQ